MLCGLDASTNRLQCQTQVSATRINPLLRGADGARNLGVRINHVEPSLRRGRAAQAGAVRQQLELARGEIVIMTGPSGSGKTTLLTLDRRTANRAGRQRAGDGARDGRSERSRTGRSSPRHRLHLSGAQLVRVADFATERAHGAGAEDESRASRPTSGPANCSTALGLGHRMDYKPESLSGGQRQRVAIARALANRPQMILADEPTAALDKQSGRDVVELLKKIAKEELATILIVTHDNRILDVADRIVNMVDGHVISDVVVSESSLICEFLRKSPLFAALTPTTLSEVADKMALEKYPAGTVIVRQGDVGDKFYLIRSGAAKVTVDDGSGPRPLATLDQGDIFGEAALMSGDPRNATVTASEDIELCTLGKEEFRAVLEQSSTFKEQLLRVLFERQ